MGSYIRRKSCASCESRRGSLQGLADLGEVPITLGGSENKLPLKLSYCDGCDLVQTDSMIHPDSLYKDYKPFHPDMHSDHFCEFVNDLVDRFGDLSNEKMHRDLSLIRRKKILEFGCSDGVLLNQLKKAGADILGVDPCTKAVKRARANGSLFVIGDYFNQKNFLKRETENEYDMVIANSTLDRMVDLSGTIKTVKHILKSNGYFIFEVYYLDSLTKKENRDNICHEHVYYFSITALQRLFEFHGMTVIDFKDVAGGVRVFVENNQVIPEDEIWERIDKEEKTLADLEFLRGIFE